MQKCFSLVSKGDGTPCGLDDLNKALESGTVVQVMQVGADQLVVVVDSREATPPTA